MNAHDLIQEIIERKGKIENVFWIACGGSMIDLMPANELLKREATTFASTVYTAREFCLMAPKSLGPKSLVVACSHSGNTQEVVDGCEMALAAGAEVVAMTDYAGSKIDNGKWTTWVYPWGKGESQAEVPQGIGVLARRCGGWAWAARPGCPGRASSAPPPRPAMWARPPRSPPPPGPRRRS